MVGRLCAKLLDDGGGEEEEATAMGSRSAAQLSPKKVQALLPNLATAHNVAEETTSESEAAALGWREDAVGTPVARCGESARADPAVLRALPAAAAAASPLSSRKWAWKRALCTFSMRGSSPWPPWRPPCGGATARRGFENSPSPSLAREPGHACHL
ncbi:unnamed protein product [Prorocentrum cordatum]|uniref:Uncharacterized protein n=1 Tax=Prorocentrum cordatum TaxID=2364126 RepID=A0ABN9TE66_9DINO|nr:unnamed protein product [Polarella glacialis]